MMDDQHRLHSGFGAAATAAEVLRGVDLRGREMIVTGGHSRLGREVTLALVEAGASVTVAARDPERAASTLGSVAGIRVEPLDLTDLRSVDAFADGWLDRGTPLHALINNAATLFSPVRRLDARGHELSFSTAHLGHFHLTRSLLPTLREAAGSRVVTVTSGAARFGQIHWDDLAFENGYDPGAAYGQSKRANVLFSVELDRRYAPDGIRGFAAHPGVVIGPGPHDPAALPSYRAQGLVDERGLTIIDPAAGKKSPAQGAATIVFGAVSPLLDDRGGLYLKDCDVAELDDADRPLTADDIPAEANSAMLDPHDARRLWEVSEQLVA